MFISSLALKPFENNGRLQLYSVYVRGRADLN